MAPWAYRVWNCFAVAGACAGEGERIAGTARAERAVREPVIAPCLLFLGGFGVGVGGIRVRLRGEEKS